MLPIIISGSSLLYFLVNLPRYSGKKYSPIVWLAPMRSTPSSFSCQPPIAAFAYSISAQMFPALCKRIFPAEVSATFLCFAVLSIKDAPKNSSSFFICTLAVGCDILRFCAALVKLRYSATAKNVSSSSIIVNIITKFN